MGNVAAWICAPTDPPRETRETVYPSPSTLGHARSQSVDVECGQTYEPKVSSIPDHLGGFEVKEIKDDTRTVLSSQAGRKSSFGTILYPLFMLLFCVCVTVFSAFFSGWLGEGTPGEMSLASVLRYGSIPAIAAVIGYTTNVIALQMMFWPLEFIGCFPRLKLPPPLDFFLCGYQGVIPMKAREMALNTYALLTEKIIRPEEMFDKLDPKMVQKELEPSMPGTISRIMDSAGRRAMPRLWEHLPNSTKAQLKSKTSASAGTLVCQILDDIRDNLEDVFDLEHCVVEYLCNNKIILNEMFFACGQNELVFIKKTGFYLGYFLGVFQMLMWVFVRHWWILPVCGIVVGYLTNAFALKAIFLPVEPRPLCGGCYTLHGLFLKRQPEVAGLYAHILARDLLTSRLLLDSLCSGPKSARLNQLLLVRVEVFLEEQAGFYKRLLLVLAGSEAWIAFREAVCQEFLEHFPAMMFRLEGYMDEAMQLETTIRVRTAALPHRDFERLLHSAFEQDEFKLILVGSILGAAVGFLQALAQEPQQLGLG